ncbi:comF family protein [Chitinophaga terrae (ex Kim and Jung 2007)]|uniref:ComF family protein n=1 Tax=Chitinophaga terrae (ex Kim and Jung 2007) TaxID=408074 RepID=A0A1H4GI68_9BACT|nr:ComF family protein [Chitinophaga terrae (ex Kim and Jung 2007)]MDQ0105572.1 ComF family protein [Chitinophaga terrae (ex Kim and Jung 2007)]GEP93470.1 amidophosphoribosyltransferase [Chitinophaga terrae (ex Kim and Jung 2007)]SEB09305.1 comF family protein [Chitinophaga terrae (ex Kim and Jung 2007)]
MLTRLLTPLVQLFYPHCCEVCGAELPAAATLLCFRCIEALPRTGFEQFTENPVSRLFTGRVNTGHAFAVYYYHHTSALRQLIHLFKYKKRQDVALWMGRQMGLVLSQTTWAEEIDMLAPVPLFSRREKERGYNQSALLCKGIAEVIKKPVDNQLILRRQFTSTQTRKSRAERWQNVADIFTVNSSLKDKHILLVDDVITTGATTEACANALLTQEARVSICALAFTWH